MEGPGVRAGFVIATSRYESRTEPTRTQDPWSPIHRCSHPILFLSEPRQDIALKDSQSIGGYDYWRRMPVAGLKTPCHIQSSACLNCFATLEDRTSDMIRRLPSDRSARRLVGFGEFLSTSR